MDMDVLFLALVAFSDATLLPAVPTDAEPGSPEKIAVMQRRLESGEALFHPRDRGAFHADELFFECLLAPGENVSE